MADHGAILTHFESLFNSQIEHEVIKIVLQSCNWEEDVAIEKLYSIVGTSEKEAKVPSNLDSPSNYPINNSSAWSGQVNKAVYRAPSVSPSVQGTSRLPKKPNEFASIENRIKAGERIMLILRGLPGSGKTTLAKSLCHHGNIHSTDNFFYVQGKYRYNPHQISEAHEWNKEQAKSSLSLGVTPVIIDNTNLEAWEMEPYVKLALDFGYFVEFLEPQTSWRYNPRELFRKCTHNVPKRKIEDMKAKFQRSVTPESVIAKIRGYGARRADAQSPDEQSPIDSDDCDVLIEDSDVEKSSSPNPPNGSNYLGSTLSSPEESESVNNIIQATQSRLESLSIDSDDKDKGDGSYIDLTSCLMPNLSRMTVASQTSSQLQLSPNESENFNVIGQDCSWSTTSDALNISKDSVYVGNSSSTVLSESHSSASLPFTQENFDELVTHMQSAIEKNLKGDKTSLFQPNDNSNSDEFSSDREVYEFCQKHDLGEASSVFSNITEFSSEQEKEIETGQGSSIIWDNVPPSDIDSSWKPKNVTENTLNGKSLSRREQRRKPGDPNKWIGFSESKIEDPSIKEWIPLESGEVTWDEKEESKEILENPSKSSPSSDFADVDSTLKKFIDCDTQACFSDFVSLNGGNSTSNVLTGDPSRFIPGNFVDLDLPAVPLTRGKLMLDKGSMTEEKDSSLSFRDALMNLAYLFPDIPKGDLKELLEKCNHDIDWAVNILIDSGHSMEENSGNLHSLDDLKSPTPSSSEEELVEPRDSKEEPSHFEPNIEEAPKKVSKNLPSLAKDVESSFYPPKYLDDRGKRLTGKDFEDLNINKIQNRRNHSQLPQKKEDTNSEGVDDKEASQYLSLNIDPLFASQLVNIFGPVGKLSMGGNFSHEDRNIFLPLEICYHLHKYWADSLDGKFSQETAVLDNLIKADEELALKLQKEEEMKARGAPPDEFWKDPPTSFREIMDLEKALSKSVSNTVDNSSYSYKLKLNNLYTEFSHINPATIEEELVAEDGDYYKTRSTLQLKYGLPDVLQPNCLASGAVAEHLTTEEEEPPDWEGEIVPENPQAYRDEANLYYEERQKAFSEAQKASRQGMVGVAAYYAHLGNLHTQKLKEANERAASKILETFNSTKDANTLDLHLLHVPEALKATQSFLSERKKVLANRDLKKMNVFIITGRGKNSTSGQSILKPAITRFLTKSGYQFSEANVGMLSVTLKNVL